jgi:NADH-quinone oxidoreductase subunit K
MLFLIGFVGIVINRQSLLISIMCIEVMLLGLVCNFSIYSQFTGNNLGQILSLFILSIAAAESAVGLGLLITAFKANNSLNIQLYDKSKY